MDQKSPFHLASIGLILLIIVVVFLFFLRLIDPFSLFSNESIYDSIFFSVFSALVALLAAILYVKYSFIHLQKTEYDIALYHLKNEIEENYKRFKAFPQLIDNEKVKWDDGKLEGWLPKNVSFTNWSDQNKGNFSFKYLPSNAYYNFINKGYILDVNYCKIDLTNLHYFYESCIQFSTLWQQFENVIHQIVPKEKQKLLKNGFTIPINSYSFDTFDDFIKYIKCDFYNSYRDKTSLNNGIEFSYQAVMKSLDKCERGPITRFKEWLIKKLCFCLEREKKNKE